MSLAIEDEFHKVVCKYRVSVVQSIPSIRCSCKCEWFVQFPKTFVNSIQDLEMKTWHHGITANLSPIADNLAQQ